MSNKVTEDQEVFEKTKHTKDSDRAHSLVKYESGEFDHNLQWTGVDHKTTSVSKYAFTNALFSRVNHNMLNVIAHIHVQKAQTTGEGLSITYVVVYVKLKENTVVTSIIANKMEKGLNAIGLYCIPTSELDDSFEFLVSDKDLTKTQKEDISSAWEHKKDINYSIHL